MLVVGKAVVGEVEIQGAYGLSVGVLAGRSQFEPVGVVARNATKRCGSVVAFKHVLVSPKVVGDIASRNSLRTAVCRRHFGLRAHRISHCILRRPIETVTRGCRVLGIQARRAEVGTIGSRKTAPEIGRIIVGEHPTSAKHLVVAFLGLPNALRRQRNILKISNANGYHHCITRNIDIHIDMFSVAGGANGQGAATESFCSGSRHRKLPVIINQCRDLYRTTLHRKHHEIVVVVGVVESVGKVKGEGLREISKHNGSQRIDYHGRLVFHKTFHRKRGLHRLPRTFGVERDGGQTRRVLQAFNSQASAVERCADKRRVAIGQNSDDDVLVGVVGVVESVGQIDGLAGRVSAEHDIADGIDHYRRQVASAFKFVGAGARRVGTGFAVNICCHIRQRISHGDAIAACDV